MNDNKLKGTCSYPGIRGPQWLLAATEFPQPRPTHLPQRSPRQLLFGGWLGGLWPIIVRETRFLRIERKNVAWREMECFGGRPWLGAWLLEAERSREREDETEIK